MTSIATLRARRTIYRKPRIVPFLQTEAAREHSIRRRVTLAWCLLFLNALGYIGSLIHLPGFVGKAITQGALPLALLVALSINRRVILRPNVFLVLMSLLVIEALLTALQP